MAIASRVVDAAAGAVCQAPRALEELAARLTQNPAATWEWIERIQEAQARPRAEAPRQRGAVCTPWHVAQRMAERLLTGFPRNSAVHVLDAGCGNGRLLVAVARQAEERRLSLSCQGVEIDAATARRAQALEPLVRAGAGGRLRSWKVRRADFLLEPTGGDIRFDAAIANPPYVPLRRLEASYRGRLRPQLGRHASGDLAALFVARLLASVREGGRLCVIVPNKLLASSYAAALRRELLEEHCLEEIWDFSTARVFRGQGTYPVILVVRCAPPEPGQVVQVHDARGEVRARWTQAALRDLPDHVLPLGMRPEVLDLARRLLAGRKLGDAVRVSCGIAVSGFGRAVGSGPERIIRSGDVRAFQVRGAQPFAPERAGVGKAVLQRQRAPKVVVPGMFRRLCAAYDGDGRLLGRVYFMPVEGGTPAERQLRRALLLALLNSRLYAVLYAGMFAAVAQSGGYTRLNAPYLRCLPWPTRPPRPDLVHLVHRLEQTPDAPTRARLEAAVESLFGLSADERRLLGQLEAALPAPAGTPGDPRVLPPDSRQRPLASGRKRARTARGRPRDDSATA